MEQLNKIILLFEAFVKKDDGKAVPFSLRVLQPEYDEERGFYCIVECPFIREKHFKIFGAHEEQACKLSISFIRQLVEDQKANLVDVQGNEASIPTIPPETIIPVDSSETESP